MTDDSKCFDPLSGELVEKNSIARIADQISFFPVGGYKPGELQILFSSKPRPRLPVSPDGKTYKINLEGPFNFDKLS